jgi:enamine deaminase RidA (YjgF/YER057c/UK114 family)
MQKNNTHADLLPVDQIENRLEVMGLVLPRPIVPPPGTLLPFKTVQVAGSRVLISGHGPLNADGTVAGPLGKVGRDVTLEQAYQSARLTALSILGSLKLEIGDLNRIRAWRRVFGMVNSAPGFNQLPSVLNGFSDLILELYGPERGAHTRSAVGLAELPFNIPVEIEGEVELYD